MRGPAVLDVLVLIAVLVVLTLAGVWLLLAVGVALLTGGMIHERDLHDRPLGGSRVRPSIRVQH